LVWEYIVPSYSYGEFALYIDGGVYGDPENQGASPSLL